MTIRSASFSSLSLAPLFASVLLSLLSVVAVAGCGGNGGDDAADAAVAVDAPVEDLEMRAEDFECIKKWDKVNLFFVTNKLGHKDAALAVAKAGRGTYPVGTVIQLVPFEAMVKRRAGFSPASNDWEFFNIQDNADGTTTIVTRGGDASVKNRINGKPCLTCHQMADADRDLVCEKGHGCESLGIPDNFIIEAQDGDKRCK